MIIGGGFGGLYAARSLRKAAVKVTLVDRRNHHLFQPLLYQVATGALSPANIAAPLRALLRRQKNAQVLLGEVIDVDVAGRRVVLRDGELPYDTLIVAAGATHSYFGHPEWEPFAPSLKTIDDATSIRRKILLAFETAERSHDPEAVARWLTFVIVGAGPTGVEMAGAVAELARETLRNDFRAIDPTRARIVLVEAADRILPPFAPDLSARARQELEQMRVEVRTRTLVTAIEPAGVLLKSGETTERIATHTVIWSAGVAASPLARSLAEKTGAEGSIAAGRIRCPAAICRSPVTQEVFVIGDMGLCRRNSRRRKPLPGLAAVAIATGALCRRN